MKAHAILTPAGELVPGYISDDGQEFVDIHGGLWKLVDEVWTPPASQLEWEMREGDR